MHRHVIGLLAAGCVFSVSANAAYLQDQYGSQPVVTDLYDRNVVSENDLDCMTLAIYHEGGSTGEPEIGMRHIARVIAERARANRAEWGGPTICGVVFHKNKHNGKCQFTFACKAEARRLPQPGKPYWEASKTAARAELEGQNDGPSEAIRYYMNAPLSNPETACKFRKEFVRVTAAGSHEFFREATADERRELVQGDWHDCRRYAAVVQKSRAKSGSHAKSHSSRKRYAGKTGRRG